MSYCTVAPQRVVDTLKKHLLVDGFHLVIDLEKSHGSWIHDAVTGREVLDFYSYFASLPIGHNHPRLTGDPEFLAALQRAALANPSNSDIYTAEYAGFVDSFARLAMPPEFRYLFFVAGGSLAVENALKTAFDWKVRTNRAAGRPDGGSRILHFREAFHGRSGYALSLTNTDPVKTEMFPTFPWPRVTNPKLEYPLTPASLERTITLEALAVEEIRAAFAAYPHEIAAIIIEPIQGEGGDNHFRAEFLQQLRALADEHDALLIFDEVQTGVGLTGRMWAWQHFDVVPDIVAFGKKTQACGIMVGPRIDTVPDNVFHVSSRINSTWGGNLADMVRAVRYLEVIEEENLVDNAAQMGARLLEGLERLAMRHELVGAVRGRGLMTAFTLPSSDKRNALRQACWERGLATLASGPRSIRFRPCLNVQPQEIDLALSVLEQALVAISEVHAPVRTPHPMPVQPSLK
jgi:L-lysine 6-transaminase